jgi:hypothetical protein
MSATWNFAPTGQIFVKFSIGGFLIKMCSENASLVKIKQKIKGALNGDLCTLVTASVTSVTRVAIGSIQQQ